jgi:hypothetical protein
MDLFYTINGIATNSRKEYVSPYGNILAYEHETITITIESEAERLAAPCVICNFKNCFKLRCYVQRTKKQRMRMPEHVPSQSDDVSLEEFVRINTSPTAIVV